MLSADPPLGHGLVCAAVRETFEESGVLLAGAGPDDVVDVSGPDWEQERIALLDRRESLSSLLERRGLGLRADLLRPWAHWITPELEPRRYDTRFFVAALPAGQRTRHVGGEADATMWITPAEAVARFERDELPMMPPTIATLRELAEYSPPPPRCWRPPTPVTSLRCSRALWWPVRTWSCCSRMRRGTTRDARYPAGRSPSCVR